MTTIQRKLLVINGLLGLGITLSAAVADHFDFLRSLERWFYGRRATYCQYFAPPPSDRLVFLDIDDNAVELERWPWSRTSWAEIIDEVSNAKPAAVFLDILFTEPQVTQVPMPDGSVVGSSRVDLQACKLEYSIVSPK